MCAWLKIYAKNLWFPFLCLHLLRFFFWTGHFSCKQTTLLCIFFWFRLCQTKCQRKYSWRDVCWWGTGWESAQQKQNIRYLCCCCCLYHFHNFSFALALWANFPHAVLKGILVYLFLVSMVFFTSSSSSLGKEKLRLCVYLCVRWHFVLWVFLEEIILLAL